MTHTSVTRSNLPRRWQLASLGALFLWGMGCHESVPLNLPTPAADAILLDTSGLETQGDGSSVDVLGDTTRDSAPLQDLAQDTNDDATTADLDPADGAAPDAQSETVSDAGNADTLFDAESTSDVTTADAADGTTDTGFEAGTDSGTDVDNDALSDAATPDAIDYDTIAAPDIDLPEFGPYVCGSEEGLALFKTKVEPIVFGSQPKTCNQCHLAGIDLNMWVQDTPCGTMACMVGSGMVDFADPAESKILKMIHMAEPESKLITSDVINTEYVAMLEWITYSAQCHTGECGDIPNACGSGMGDVPVPEEVINPLGLGCTDEALVQSFHDRVYEPWKGRCHGCHSKFDDPSWAAPAWLVENVDTSNPVEMLQGAMISMYNLVGLGAMNTDDPLQSMMLLKPLKESEGGVYHGGGHKFVDFADEAYQDFALFLEQYSACYHAEDYPKPVVTITFPNKYNKKFTQGDTIDLEGFAIDAQDGVIPEGGLIWHSDLVADPIGYGEGPISVMLPVGKQVITLRAYDDDNNVATRMLTIQVKAPQP